MAQFLSRWERIKKDKHGKHCHDQLEHFFAVCSLGVRNSRERTPGRTLSTDSIHGIEKRITPFRKYGGG